MDNAVKAPAIDAACPNGKALNPRYITAMCALNMSTNDCIFILCLYPCLFDSRNPLSIDKT